MDEDYDEGDEDEDEDMEEVSWILDDLSVANLNWHYLMLYSLRSTVQF